MSQMVYNITLTLILIGAYWVPTIVALLHRTKRLGPVIVVNAFLGWTGIGWIVALAMACGEAKPSCCWGCTPQYIVNGCAVHDMRP